jgi:DNA-binding transcriptional MerR regulator
VSTLLNIAALSRRTGIAPDTLRKWEQRYGVLRPTRTAGGQRRYTERDVARVEWLRDRLAEGWRISEAARVLDEGDAPATADPEELCDALVQAIATDSLDQADALLDQAFAVLPLEQVLSEVIAPTLRAVGDGWHGGTITIAQEHAISDRVRAHLYRLLADSHRGTRGTAVLACAPGEYHDLGLLMVSVLLWADAWRVEFLGANTPVEHAVAFAESIGADLVCFSAALEEPLERLQRGLAALPARPLPALVVGGAAVGPEQAKLLGATYTGSSLAGSVARLRRLGA